MFHLLQLPETDEDSKLTWGKLKYDNGFYLGQFNEQKQRHGRGSYSWTNDKIYYVGYWKANIKDRYGKLLDGHFKVTYEGGYVNGTKNGKGKLYFANGDLYEGDFKNDKREGKGTYNWADGSKWEGTFANSQMHGTGTYYPNDGEEPWEVEYQNGQCVG